MSKSFAVIDQAYPAGRNAVEVTFGQARYNPPILFIISASYVLGRQVDVNTRAILGAHEAALRALVRREALLEEARMELEQALRIGGPGRYTGLEVGSYQLGHLIGRGAMGEVYDGKHSETGQEAAIKLLRRESLRDARSVERFLRETAIVASIVSPHVVRVLEVSPFDSDIKYLAMERLRGQSLADLLRERTRLDMDQVIDLLRQVGAGVAAAHQAGIVHRDLKAHNIFHHGQGPGATWKILDFGVSKLMVSDGTLTGSNIVGTPGYMSPEQARGAKVDARTDIYALGIIAYRAMTGHPAFSGGDIAKILYRVIHQMPIRPSAFEGVPEAMDSVLAVAIAKDAAMRFGHPDELADAVEAARRNVVDPDIQQRAREVLSQHPWSPPRQPVTPAQAESALPPVARLSGQHTEKLPG